MRAIAFPLHIPHHVRVLDDTFPYKVCINLDRRPERWAQMQRKFAEHGIDGVRRMAAADGEKLERPAHWTHTAGAYGCLRSHLDAVIDARRIGAESVLVFEDDVVFDHDLQEKFGRSIHELPDDWDMLFFGALHKDDPIPVSERLVKLTRANSTYAYALRNTVFDAFIDINERAADVLDNNNYALQETFNCYCFMPHLAWVETGYSDAQRRLEHHWYLQESLVLFGRDADRLLRDTSIVFAHRGPTENLLYLVDYYNEFFESQLAMVIVEHDARQSIDASALPANCRYVFLCDDGPFDRERCFTAGVAAADPSRQFRFLSDSDLYLETMDFRANLRMCERYGAATGFRHVIELDGDDSRRLRVRNTTRGLDVTRYAAALDRNDVGCRFVRAGATLQPPPRDTVFRSPNHALRLRSE
jgi:glycosyl transferase family 25